MANFLDLLNQINGEEETEKPVIPFAQPQATMPDNLAQAAQEEAMDIAPVRAPAQAPAPVASKIPAINPAELGNKLDSALSSIPDTQKSTETRVKTKVSGTIPESDKSAANETAEARLERLMRELNEQRNKEREEAASRQFKAEIAQALTKGIGGIVGGAQAMNTGAKVDPIKTGNVDVGDLVAGVDKKFAGDREALLDQYKQLLNARDRQDQRKYQQETLEIQREGNRIKQQLADKKGNMALTEGQKAQDKDFGKINNDWVTTGRAKFNSNLSKLQEVANKIESMSAKDKKDNNRFQGRLPDILQPEEALSMRDAVRSAAQESLRATLGAQFTEKEGEMIMNRAYDPTLSPAENLKRINSVINELVQKQQAMDARSAEFENQGTLKNLKTTPNAPVSGGSKPQAPTGKIAVSNGKETLYIDPADEADAATDKYYRIK